MLHDGFKFGSPSGMNMNVIVGSNLDLQSTLRDLEVLTVSNSWISLANLIVPERKSVNSSGILATDAQTPDCCLSDSQADIPMWIVVELYKMWMGCQHLCAVGQSLGVQPPVLPHRDIVNPDRRVQNVP